jgi:hypothetical protein
MEYSGEREVWLAVVHSVFPEPGILGKLAQLHSMRELNSLAFTKPVSIKNGWSHSLEIIHEEILGV